MKNKFQEKGQALVIIALSAVVLFGFAALAIDGSRVFSDKRHAQNAADTAALAGALAYSRGTVNDINAAAQNRATSNGYDSGVKSDVYITHPASPPGVCPANTVGVDITVGIDSYVDTTFARVIGTTQIINRVSATARSCGSYTGPPFNGNALVSLAPTGTGYNANGNVNWNITGGGILSNSSSADAANCNGNATTITVPSVTVVGNFDWGQCGVTTDIPPDNTATQLSYSDYAAFFPRQPICNGTASYSSGDGKWYPQPLADGSKVSFSGSMDFAPGIYCVINSPGPYNGAITGSEVTFFIPASNVNFEIKFAGGGSFNASAPTSGEYEGVLMYAAPIFDSNGNLIQTQEIDLRGNGNADIVGTIITPSAEVTMFGNSGSGALRSQIIAYRIDAGGTADINLAYNANDNLNSALPIMLTLLK